jgi:hypothetical protein
MEPQAAVYVLRLAKSSIQKRHWGFFSRTRTNQMTNSFSRSIIDLGK